MVLTILHAPHCLINWTGATVLLAECLPVFYGAHLSALCYLNYLFFFTLSYLNYLLVYLELVGISGELVVRNICIVLWAGRL